VDGGLVLVVEVVGVSVQALKEHLCPVERHVAEDSEGGAKRLGEELRGHN